MTAARCATAPSNCSVGMPNSCKAEATFRFRSSNWTKRITFAEASCCRSSWSLRTRHENFVPYLSFPFSAFASDPTDVDDEEEDADAEEPSNSEGPLARMGSSLARGWMSFSVSGWLHKLHLRNFATTSSRHRMQKACAQGVMANRVRGTPSSKQMLQLRASGESSLAKAATVRRKKSSEAHASWTSCKFCACSCAWPSSNFSNSSAFNGDSANFAHCAA
mmetsp:Transcript_31077/g.89840  ORF Transcript_31077/g.89840 Transcript_31077/m.89840 type:complete len:220 (+) Transcript_31077:432-1091(+)